MKNLLIDFAHSLPKAELHLHLEGSLEPERMFMLAQRNQITLPYSSTDELKAAYSFDNLQAFLDLYYQGMSVLITEQDFYDLTYDYLTRIHQDNVIHTEVFFDPQGHLERGIDFATQINGIYRALEDGQKHYGISFKLILSFLRHLSEESAFETLELALPYLDKISGVGLDSSEKGHPPEKFARVFARAKALGLKVTVHAGEEGPPEYVWQALNTVNTDRVDHGNRSLEDPKLIQYLAEHRYTLTVCPLSNLKLCVVQSMDDHPIVKMLDHGLQVTLNSDDPAYFGGYVNDNFTAVINALQLTHAHILTLVKNSFTGSWMTTEEKDAALQRLEEKVDEWSHKRFD